MLEMKDGSRAAFELLVQRWDKRMLNYFSRCTYHRDEAEDLRQELFLRIYLRAETFKPEGNFQAWLYRIATNLVIDKVSRKKTMRAENHAQIEDQTTELALAINPGIRNKVQTGQISELIKRALDLIPQEQKIALIMRHFEGLRFEEIAQIVGESESTLKSRVYRGLTTLRLELKKMGIFEIDCFQEV